MLGVELGEGTASNWLTLAVEDGRGAHEATAGLFLVALAAAEMIAWVAGGPIVDRVGRVAAVRGSVALRFVGRPWSSSVRRDGSFSSAVC